MCGPKAPPDNSAQLARAAESARVNNVSAGQQAIDASFSKFDDDFYGKVASDFSGGLKPQLQRSYDDAYRQLTLRMAASGNLESSSAARRFGRLYERQRDTLADIESRSIDHAAEVRSNVDSQRRDLYALNSSSADPSSVGAAASSAAGSVQVSKSVPTLGDVFGDVVGGIQIGQQLSDLRNNYNDSAPIRFTPGNATGKVIG